MKQGILIIKEIFWTIQGEGSLTGLPAIFIRLAGCSTKCTWCDTDWLKGKAMDYKDIYREIDNILSLFPVNLFVVTGGEPFDQGKNLVPFVNYLLANYNQTVQIETSVPLKSLDCYFGAEQRFNINSPRLRTVLSPKISQSPDFDARLRASITIATFYSAEFKLVIDSGTTSDKLREIRNVMSAENRHDAFRISFMFEDSLLADPSTDSISKIAEVLSLFKLFKPSISPRLHNQLNIK